MFNEIKGKIINEINAGIKDETLDEKWVNEFEQNDKLFQDFYLDDIYYTKIHFIYINKDSNIEIIKEDNFLLSIPNYITREEIIGLLKRNIIENNKKYSLLSILKCNITLKPEEIKNFLKSNNLTDYLDNFLVPIKNIDEIKLEKTINMFHDLNDLIFLFYEKDNIKIIKQKNNMTKKVSINSKVKHKTTRKDY
jgi:hypothetical protein